MCFRLHGLAGILHDCVDDDRWHHASQYLHTEIFPGGAIYCHGSHSPHRQCKVLPSVRVIGCPPQELTCICSVHQEGLLRILPHHQINHHSALS